MEILTTIVDLIAEVGLPIAMVLGLGWFIYKIYKDTTAQAREREEKLYTEIAENRLVNEKAIETIGLYAERLTHIETDLVDIKNDVVTIKHKVE